MADFDRFWSERNSPYDDEDPDATGPEPPPGATEGEIVAWERAHGVTLPEPIRTALGLRDGGYVRNATIQVLPLDQIVPVDDDFWDHTEIGDDEAPDRGLVFVLGYEMEVGGTYVMNFNARGPHGAPSVSLDIHGESTHFIDDSIGGFFEAALASSAVPDVNWSEGVEDLPIVAREAVDLTALWGGKPASKDQVLARQGGALVLFTRERSPNGEVLTRTTLPLPLDAHQVGVRPYRPAPNATFAIYLQPTESEGIVEVRSETNDDGRWKNTTSRGAPIYVTFESADRDRLQALRAQLLGPEGAARAQAQQDRQAALTEALDALSPEQRTAALFQAAMGMRADLDRRFAAQSGDLGPAPPGVAEAAEAMRLKMEEMVERARRASAANPPDPETLRRIEDLLRDQGAG